MEMFTSVSIGLFRFVLPRLYRLAVGRLERENNGSAREATVELREAQVVGTEKQL